MRCACPRGGTTSRRNVVNDLQAYTADGAVLWTRAHTDYSLTSLCGVGDGFVSTLDRTWEDGPVSLRTADGDLVCQVFCKEAADCWAHTALRVDVDTARIGIVQVYEVKGLATVRSATATLALPAAGPKPE